MRFVVQWWASEKAKRSVVPMTFWWFSIGGGALLLMYALYRRDPVFILGQAQRRLSSIVRNLQFVLRAKARGEDSNSAPRLGRAPGAGAARLQLFCCAGGSAGCPSAEAPIGGGLGRLRRPDRRE